jgi:hypothetical protein
MCKDHLDKDKEDNLIQKLKVCALTAAPVAFTFAATPLMPPNLPALLQCPPSFIHLYSPMENAPPPTLTNLSTAPIPSPVPTLAEAKERGCAYMAAAVAMEPIDLCSNIGDLFHKEEASTTQEIPCSTTTSQSVALDPFCLLPCVSSNPRFPNKNDVDLFCFDKPTSVSQVVTPSTIHSALYLLYLLVS